MQVVSMVIDPYALTLFTKVRTWKLCRTLFVVNEMANGTLSLNKDFTSFSHQFIDRGQNEELSENILLSVHVVVNK